MVDETFNMAFTLDYVHKFKKEGERLLMSGHHTNFDFSSFQDVNTGYFLPGNGVPFRENKFQTFSSQGIKLYTGQIDYELPIGKGKLSAGAKYSNIVTSNAFKQYDLNGATPQIDENRTSDFIYTEQVSALYASYFSKIGEKISLNAGLRMENTLSKGDLDSFKDINDDLVERTYTNLFPSGGITYAMNKGNQFSVNYSRRIDRPNYQDLNPFPFLKNRN